MKQIIITIILSAALPIMLQAQLGKNILNRVKSTAENRVINKSATKTNEVMDKIEGKAATTKPKKEERSSSQTPAESTPKPEGEQKTNESSAKNSDLKLYAKFDFVPGEKIIYHNDFTGEAMGELPIGWNSNGTGAVATFSGVLGNWVKLNQNSMYLTDNKDSLSENFTVEFDLLLHRSNPKEPFPMMAFGVLASGSYSPVANELLKNYAGEFCTELKIQPYDNNGSHLHLQTFTERSKHLTTDIKKWQEMEQHFNKTIHVAMQVQKERLRVWFNEIKMYDLPKAIVAGSIINQLYFDVKRYGGPDEEVGYAIGNIKMAKGLPDTRHKLVEEGKFSTTGILFDVNAATIKPESNGVLKEIADVLQKHSEIKVKIIGHTDSDGSDNTNLDLSRKRAEAVKQFLIKEYAIDAARLDSEGKGEKEAIGDNKTKEGKAQNRRVEFVKQ